MSIIITLLTLTSGQPAVADQACFPTCRSGYVCHVGRCIEACNPACGVGQTCTNDGTCVTSAASPEEAATVGGAYFSLGFGPAIGNTRGGVLDLEAGFGGGDRHYFAAILFGLGGVNSGDDPISHTGAALGYRGFFFGGSSRMTLFIGPMVAHRIEFERSGQTRYIVVWPRINIGFVTTLSQSSWWGLEAGTGIGYQFHYNDERDSENYSSFNGHFDTRFRIQF